MVYNVDKLLDDGLYNMAHLRNQTYDLEYKITVENATVSDQLVSESAIESHKKWYKSKTQMERVSSLFCCLSLRSKLNLIGLHYVKVDEDSRPALTEEQFMSIYCQGDMPCYDKYKNVLLNGKKIVYYDINFRNSLRKTFAIHEHQRWNAFMISKGVIPSTLDQILNEQVMKNGADEAAYYARKTMSKVRRKLGFVG
jgi:hypothetical protein